MVSELFQAASRATSASPGNYRSFGGRGDGPSTPGHGINTGEKTTSPVVFVAQMQGGDGNDVGIAQVSDVLSAVFGFLPVASIPFFWLSFLF